MVRPRANWPSADVTWTEKAIEHAAEHEITVEQANEALDDPDAIEADPDPRTNSVAAYAVSTTAAAEDAR